MFLKVCVYILDISHFSLRNVHWLPMATKVVLASGLIFKAFPRESLRYRCKTSLCSIVSMSRFLRAACHVTLHSAPSGVQRREARRAVPHRIPVRVGAGRFAWRDSGSSGGGQGDREQCHTVGRGPRPSLRSREAWAGCRSPPGQRSGRGSSTAGTRTAPQHLCSLGGSTTCSCYCSFACHICLLKQPGKAVLYLEGF